MTDTVAAKARLEEMLAELTARLAHIETDLDEPADADSGERAVQQEDDATLEGQAELVAREIASVTRALERIANGAYGECTKCGAEIAAGRLAARPEAALCIDCAG
ncbi:TraR/DksA family transcriptional regulator [Alteraurantiacibacter buctensis]|uniref:TraR/DksA family transcriptional regulator n=1 Tax=Alteraurantiacibacter buctensis TaxID=1503981 RepID=A0A844YSN3_9SPHN|nr:TraR/DksA family transcriptional regulator [Alteraurantiacibacter buctensis]MXO70092.1 TraR/DksA family transcriptional regulator [Alteraurantiacibacter buctensis]